MSLYENLSGCVTLTAGADLSAAANQYKLVKINTSAQVVLGSVAGEVVVGILYNKPTSGSVAAVKRLNGEKALVKAGGAITKGDLLAVDATGQVKVAVKGNGAGITGSFVVGIALEAASSSGDIIQILTFAVGTVATTAA